jgi:hypothetical protein
MEKQALYFPYIRVPAAGWFTSTLLYWDSVGTIVPWSLAASDPVLGAYTSELMSADLVRAVWPENYIFSIDGFAERFFEVIDRNEGIDASRERALDAGRTGRIHDEKFTDVVFYGLQERGLAERSSDQGWWNVESQTAGVYMAYLAATLGALGVLGMDPVSDTDLFVSTPETPVARAEALRLSLLEAILPGPEEPVPVRELATFKERHADTLKAFRTAIESELLRIALIDDDEARGREKARTEERLRHEIDEITAAMRQRRWPRILFGTIAGLAAVAATGAAALGRGGVALAFAAPGVISGANSAVDGFPRRQRSNSPLAFAAFAGQTFPA